MGEVERVNDPFVATLVIWVVSSTTTALALWLDRRRLDEHGRRRMWRDTTLQAAVSGLFLPAPLTFGAHVWVTRSWPWWLRAPAAVVASVAMLAVVELICQLLYWASGASPPG